MTLALLGIGIIFGALAMFAWCWFFDCCTTNTSNSDSDKTSSNNPTEPTTEKSSNSFQDSTDNLANEHKSNESNSTRSNISVPDTNSVKQASITEPSDMQIKLQNNAKLEKNDNPENNGKIVADIDELKDNLPIAATSADDLKKIKGIGPVLEKMLNDLGITTFRQVALLNNRQAQEVAIAIKTFPDRMHRDNWLPQAAELHLEKYKEKVK